MNAAHLSPSPSSGNPPALTPSNEDNLELQGSEWPRAQQPSCEGPGETDPATGNLASLQACTEEATMKTYGR